MNKAVITGRLTKDIVLSDKGVAKFTVASQRNFKNADGKYEADFINCTAFGKNAEFISKYFSKGSQICVEGRINTGSYTNKDGNKVFTTDVAVDRAEFIGSAKADAAQGGDVPKSDAPKAAAPAKGGEADFMNIPEGVDDFPPFG